MKDLKEIHEKPKEKFDWDLAASEEKTRRIKRYGLLASLMRGVGEEQTRVGEHERKVFKGEQDCQEDRQNGSV